MRRTLVTLVVSLFLAAAVPAAEEKPRLFSPPRRPAVPRSRWGHNPIDAFILARLEAKDLVPSREADRLRLLRRVTFDLTGLPPTVAEQDAFLTDASPDVYARVVDRLLASPAFGERLAQPWLDLVRYAETDGFNQDALRPTAHRYRDWVIRALNDNVPYDRFVRLQLAGDELEPDDADALVAAGFNRLWPDEHNAANIEQRRQEILDDATDTAGLVFLGLTVGCARCHDHKYDPISQKDYFRLQAFFAPMQPREVVATDPATRREHAASLAVWEKATKSLREEADRLVSSKRKEERASLLLRFNPDIRAAVNTSLAKRTPYQWQIALTTEKQLDRAEALAHNKLPAAVKRCYLEIQTDLAKFGPAPELPTAMTVLDIGREAPPTYRLIGGDWRKPARAVEPGFPAAFGDAVPNTRLQHGRVSTGRRAALARWLTRPDHPLTARVIVNRLWQHHFGVGLVATASDFGAQGTPPTHPDLLDWLASELVSSGWNLKHLHRLMVLSATYRQDSAGDAKNPGLAVDPDNRLLWRARRRRLEGEAIRDAMFALSGELTRTMFGPSARPKLPAAFGNKGWKPDDDIRSRNRRSVYVFAKRNLRYPLFDAFDQPDLHNSCACRLRTTTAPQALLLLNGGLTIERACAWMESLRATHGADDSAVISAGYRAAWGRPASSGEIGLAKRFVARQAMRYQDGGAALPEATRKALLDFCHAVLNTNEFVFLD
jgi:Protein of unknown function (DUF1553)/Protein of unknown function (DUF1549)